MTATAPSLAELLRVAYHRRWWLLGPVVAGVVLALVAYRLVTPVYRASTLIMAEPQRVPSEYFKPTVTANLQDRLKTIEQQIINRQSLTELISTMELYPEMRASSGLPAAVEAARRDITIQILGSNVLRIHFRAADPVVAADVANWIAERFIGNNLRLRERQARTTSSFLQGELDDMRVRLEEQEARIAEFKRIHTGQLPEERETLLRTLEGLQGKLQMTLDDFDKIEVRRLILHRDTVGRTGEVNAELTRLQQLREDLAVIRSRYTELHPDVIRTREAIARLEAELAAMPPPAPAPSDQDPRLAIELAAVNREVSLLEQERRRILAEIVMLQARLDNIPHVEQELLSLTRDYDNIRDSYQSLLAKRIDAQMAENLERSRQSEQFTVLERAVPPASPHFPNLLLLLAVGVCGGGLAGIGAAALREQTDQTYTEAESLQKDFPRLPVLATIPLLGGPARLGHGYHVQGQR